MPIITLTSDLGQDDYLVGAIKGQLLTIDDSFVISDISHTQSAGNYPLAAYVCSNAFKYYPSNTFHVILVNLFENNNAEVLLAYHNGHYLACANNGLLTMITAEPPTKVVAVPVDLSKGIHTLTITATIAKAFKRVLQGESLEEIGTSSFTLNEKYPLRSAIGSDWMEGQIINIDRFQNVVINITKEEFDKHRQGRNFKIWFSRSESINVISNNYASVGAGELLAWFNSAGYLELAINKGKLAALFGLQGYADGSRNPDIARTQWLYTSVKILFE